MTRLADGTSKLQFHEIFDRNNRKSDISRTIKNNAKNNAKPETKPETNPEKLKTSLAAAAERAIIANKQIGYEATVRSRILVLLRNLVFLRFFDILSEIFGQKIHFTNLPLPARPLADRQNCLCRARFIGQF